MNGLPKKVIPAILGFIVSLIIAIVLIHHYSTQQQRQDSLSDHQLFQVERADIEEVVTSQGKLEPKEFVDVGAQVSGQLKKLHVEVGDTVQTGELLAEIDPTVYESRVQGDKAKLKTLEAQLAEQQAQILHAQQLNARNQRLVRAKAISLQTLEDSVTDLKVAQAKANALKAQIEESQFALQGDQANLSYTKIYAPIAGTVVSQTARVGQTLNANQSAPVILQIADLSVMTVEAQVAEADVMRLRPDMEVYFTTLGALEKRWKGRVRQILPAPEIINDVVLYHALVDVKNEDNQLMSGMSTQMFFVIGRAKNAIVIPVAALGKKVRTGSELSGQAYLVKVAAQDGKPWVEKTVVIGLMNRSYAEVKSGVTVGDKVVVPKQQGDADPSTSRQRRQRFGPSL